jgi:hypothetical protein
MNMKQRTIKSINLRFATKRVPCPQCGARPGRDCISTRIPSANSFGGGWGGYQALSRSHSERVAEARLQRQRRIDAVNLISFPTT